jgi:hypothetical protein
MENTNDTAARLEQETQAIQAAKTAAGIAYPLLVVELSHATDPAKPGPRFAFRRPNPAEWGRYRSESLDQNPQVKANALNCIVVPCCVYPDRATFAAMVGERPGLVESLGSELVEYAGIERAKKVERL